MSPRGEMSQTFSAGRISPRSGKPSLRSFLGRLGIRPLSSNLCGPGCGAHLGTHGPLSGPLYTVALGRGSPARAHGRDSPHLDGGKGTRSLLLLGVGHSGARFLRTRPDGVPQETVQRNRLWGTRGGVRSGFVGAPFEDPLRDAHRISLSLSLSLSPSSLYRITILYSNALVACAR